MGRAYIHIGHAKTGSTALQAAFSVSRPRLADHGIDYPAETDPIGKIDLERFNPGGNAMVPMRGPFGEGFEAVLSQLRPDPGRHLFLSGELIYHHIARSDILPELSSMLGELGYDDIRLLLFVRDPLPLYLSAWQQQFRSKCATAWVSGDPDEVVAQVSGLSRVLDAVDAAEGVTLTVHSYDRPAAPLIDLAETWLELPAGTLERPPKRRANRSFTRSEARLTLAVNRAMGRRNAFGQKLIQRVPDPAPDPLGLPAGVQDRITAALAAPIAAVNARLPEHARLRPGRVPEADRDGPALFNRAQIEVIAEVMADGLFAPGPGPDRSTGPARRARRPAPLWRKAIRPFDLRRWF